MFPRRSESHAEIASTETGHLPPWEGVRPGLHGRRGRSGGAGLQVEQESGEGLCVLDLAEARWELGNRPADELDLLVRVRIGLATLDVLRDVEVHLFAAEAGRRPERGELAPPPASQTALLAQLAL